MWRMYLVIHMYMHICIYVYEYMYMCMWHTSCFRTQLFSPVFFLSENKCTHTDVYETGFT